MAKANEDREDTNSKIDKQKRRKQLRCPLCPPHGGENKTHTKRGTQKRKYKQKRRKTP